MQTLNKKQKKMRYDINNHKPIIINEVVRQAVDEMGLDELKSYVYADMINKMNESETPESCE